MPASSTPQEALRFATMLPEAGPACILLRTLKGRPFAQDTQPTRRFVEAPGSMVPKGLVTTRHLSLQRWKFGQGNVDPNRPGHTNSTLDVPRSLERDDHLMHSWWRYAEVPLYVRLGWRTAIHLAVVEDECKVLALASRECGLHRCVHNKVSNVRVERRAKGCEAAFGTSARPAG